MSLSDLFVRTHFELRSIIGNRPMGIPRRLTTCFPRMYSMSTKTGAAYVISRSRHSLGVISDVLARSRRSGGPTRISVYLRRNFSNCTMTASHLRFVLEIERWVDIAQHLLVGFDDFFDFD